MLKYSFIDKVEVKNGYVLFYYTINGTSKFKKISVRATRDQTLDLISKIRQELPKVQLNQKKPEEQSVNAFAYSS